MNSFRNAVLTYLGTTFKEEEEEELASKKTEDKCPNCGKKTCECQCSKSTETAGGDDGDDGYHYSTCTEKNDKFLAGELTPEEKEMIALFRRNKSGLAGKTTPEEEKMLNLFRKNKDKFNAAVKTAFPGEFEDIKQNKEASENSPDLKDDKTNGRNGSCKTESIFNY